MSYEPDYSDIMDFLITLDTTETVMRHCDLAVIDMSFTYDEVKKLMELLYELIEFRGREFR